VFPVNAPNVLTVVRIMLVPVLVVALLDETANGDLLAAIAALLALVSLDRLPGWVGWESSRVSSR
jgi:CDP-diacylglycerol--glycerol-3-phosphate 3-phosphatidyltransferase